MHITKHPSTEAPFDYAQGRQGDARNARHRHFLAFPLFLLMLGTGVLGGGSTRLQAEILPAVTISAISARRQDRFFTLPRGIGGLLREDGILSDDGELLSLEEGTVILASDGLVRLRIGDVIFSAFHGGLLATRSGDKFSIHALSSPVLLARDSFRILIPAGMQGSWTSEDSVPWEASLPAVVSQLQGFSIIMPDLLHDELETLSSVALPPIPEFPIASAISPVLTQFALPAAQNRMAEQSARSQLREVRSAVESGDAESVHALLRESATVALLSSPDLPDDVLPALLAHASLQPSVSQELIGYVSDADVWLLLSLHPEYRSAAWETPGPLSVPLSVRVLRWFQLPSSDIGEAVPARAVAQWREQLEKYLQTTEHPDEFLEPLLQSMKDYRSFAEQNGYPERLRRYAHVLRQTVEPFAGTLSVDAQALYADWKKIDDIAPYTEPPSLPAPAEPVTAQETSSEAPEAQQEPFDPSATEAAVKKMLLVSGALFTTQTVLHAGSESSVTVQGVVFASAQAEHRYDFTMELPAKRLSHIRQDGREFPYGIGLEAFAKWASGIGGRSMDGYKSPSFLFSIPIEIGKRQEYVDLGTYRKRVEKVYVKEREGLAEEIFAIQKQ